MVGETKAFRCTCDVCGYLWFSEMIPPRCANPKCKARTWNKQSESGKVETESVRPIKKPTKAKLPEYQPVSRNFVPDEVKETVYEVDEYSQ